MPKLILIRHSQSQLDPALPASRWSLSEVGRERCMALAQRLATYAPAAIIASREPKAIETGSIVATILGIPFETADGLHEHKREHVAFIPNEAFDATIAALFERPDELVMGEETANRARERFEQAVRSVLDRYPGRNVAIVTHGTVMTLFVAKHTGVASLPFWKSLGMPALVVLSLPEFGLLEVVERLEIGD